MGKKNKKASDVDLYYLGQAEEKNKKEQKRDKKKIENQKNKKEPKKDTKQKKSSNKLEEAYNFEEEIVIGIPINNKEKQEKSNKKEKKKNSHSNKNKNNDTKKRKKENKTNKQTNRTNKTKKLTPKQEKALKKKKIILAILKWLILLMLLAGSITYLLLSPLFNIINVDVTGNSKISIEQIKSLSQIQTGENIFKIKKKEVINNIKENPYIDSVIVSRKLPNTIDIKVEERTATLQLQYANSYVYLNNQGYMLEISDKKLENAPILRGISTKQENIKEGNRLESEDLEKLEIVLSILESAKSNDVYQNIKQIDIKEKNDFILYLDEDKKIVYFGDEKDLSTKMLWIKTMLEREKDIEGELFLNKGMDSVYFREKV